MPSSSRSSRRVSREISKQKKLHEKLQKSMIRTNKLLNGVDNIYYPSVSVTSGPQGTTNVPENFKYFPGNMTSFQGKITFNHPGAHYSGPLNFLLSLPPLAEGYQIVQNNSSGYFGSTTFPVNFVEYSSGYVSGSIHVNAWPSTIPLVVNVGLTMGS